MNTIEKINFDGDGIIDKLKRGEALTKEEMKLFKIYNDLNSGRAGNAGKVSHKTRAKKGY